MKKILILLSLTAIIFAGCRKEVFPLADFVVNYNTVQPYEVVQFTDYSRDAYIYTWNFGDGTTSNLPDPNHYYEDEGDYVVTLTVESVDGNIDVATITIHVIYTLLEITVVEWNESEIVQFIVPDAFVLLYKSLNDWLDDRNAVVYGYADDYGVITFAGLEDRVYYVWAEADNVAEPGDRYDNYGFYEDGWDSYLYTQRLVPFALNTWTAWVDYYYPVKSAEQKRRDKYDISKIKRDERSFIIVDVSK